MESDTRQRAIQLIAELYQDYLNSLSEAELKLELKRFDENTGLISATAQLLDIRQQFKISMEGKQ